MKNDVNSKEIIIQNPLNVSGVLAITETPNQNSSQTKAKRKFIEILEDVRIQPSADSTFGLKKIINSNIKSIAQLDGRNSIFDSNDQYFGDHITREIIRKERASPVLGKTNDQCEICRKKLHGESSLIYHRQVHLAEYIIHCETCFEFFFSFAEKDLHEENCQKVRFECHCCRKTLLDYAALKRHMERH